MQSTYIVYQNECRPHLPLNKKEIASLQYQCSPNQAKWTKFSPLYQLKEKGFIQPIKKI